MKKIAIDARIINTTTGRYIERLLTHLQEIDKDNQYIVLVPEKDKNYWKPESKNFTIKTVSYENFSLNEQFGFAKYLYSLNADLVHFCMPQQPVLYIKPSITTMHDLILLKTYNSDKNFIVFKIKQFIGRFIFFYLAHKSRYIITPSETSRREYLERYHVKPNKVVTTLLAAEKSSSQEKEYKLPYSKYLLYVGQQSDYKNIKRLIKAHQKLLKKYPDLGLVLVGSLNESAKRNKIWSDKHKYKNVLFTGFVSDEELSWLYSNTKVYVFPSLMEGFGLPSLEAMTYGAPVVSSNATCLPEINGEAAKYFNPESVNDMAKVIDEVLTNPQLRQRLVKEGQKQVKKYSWDKTAQETLSVYTAALKNE